MNNDKQKFKLLNLFIGLYHCWGSTGPKILIFRMSTNDCECTFMQDNTEIVLCPCLMEQLTNAHYPNLINQSPLGFHRVIVFLPAAQQHCKSVLASQLY